jgi:hypothetical protein
MAGLRSEAAQFARRIVMSESYFTNLKQRAESGELAPPVEALLLHYAFGKPVEQVSLTTSSEADLGSMSVEQLAARAKRVEEMLIARLHEDRRLEEERQQQAMAEAARIQEQQQNAQRQQEQEAQSVFHKIDRGVH